MLDSEMIWDTETSIIIYFYGLTKNYIYDLLIHSLVLNWHNPCPVIEILVARSVPEVQRAEQYSDIEPILIKLVAKMLFNCFTYIVLMFPLSNSVKGVS